MPTAKPAPSAGRVVDTAYLAAHEAARAGVLRRRTVWFLGVLLFLLAISALGSFFEYQEYAEGEPTPLDVVVLGALDDLCLVALVLATLLYILRMRPDRARLVRAVTVSTVLTMAVATFFEIRRAALYQTDFLGKPVLGADPNLWGARWGLFSYGLIVCTALLIIPMRWAESIRIALACWVVYLVLVAVEARPSIPTVAVYSLLALIVPLPAMLYSAWRYQRFDAQFEHTHLKGRYGEIAAELSRARGLHEALFPTPIEDGPVRVRFVYEPMRQIGGDFLYIHRDSTNTPGAPEEFIILLVDVSGHGVTAALAVNRIHGELARVFASEKPGAAGGWAAERIIRTLNTYVCAALAPQGVYATAICIRIIPDAGGAGKGTDVEWSSAGHPPALLRSAAAGGKIHRLGPTATMLGVLDPDLYEPGSGRIGVVPGDTIVAYTDGLAEARSHDNVEFGLDRIEDVVAAGAAPSSEPRVAQTLVAVAAAHSAGRVTDDTLVVEISIAAPAPRSQAREQTPAHTDAGASSSAG